MADKKTLGDRLRQILRDSVAKMCEKKTDNERKAFDILDSKLKYLLDNDGLELQQCAKQGGGQSYLAGRDDILYLNVIPYVIMRRWVILNADKLKEEYGLLLKFHGSDPCITIEWIDYM